MHPFFNPNQYRSPQLQQPNGPSSSAPQQVIGPQNPLQMGPNPQLNQFLPNQFSNSNVAQQLGQFMNQNSINPNQLFNQNVNMDQWSLPNPMQNMGMGMGMNVNPFGGMGLPNFAQGISPQNLAILAAAQLSLINANQVANMGMQGQVQGNMGNMQGNRPSQPQQNHQMYNQAPAQVNRGNVTNNNQNGNWNQPQNKKYNQNNDSLHNRSVNSPFHHGQQGKGNFRSPEDKRGKGNQDEGPRKFIPNQSKQNQGEKKRPLVLTYTDQEIKQWREQRKKNYPLQATLQKKLADKMAASEARDEAAKLRRQQLKEILAKQAELGCEVAEIPSSYLSDSEKQVHQRGVKRPYNKKERFQNKFNKRGRFRQNDHFSKRHESGDPDPSSESQQRHQFNQNQITRQDAASKKKPTLLQKLLSADIKREKHQLLQVFRFMVMNSFFKDYPEKALKFPSVIIKDADHESSMVEEEVTRVNNADCSNDKDNDNDNNACGGNDKDGDSDNNADGGKDNDKAGAGCKHDQENDGPRNQVAPQDEEGEIIN